MGRLAVRATFPMTCQRCLAPVDVPLEVDREFRFVADEATAEALDDLLWDMGDEVYIPHQIAGLAQDDEDDEDDLAPVLILPPEADAPMRPLVINLRDVAVLAPHIYS